MARCLVVGGNGFVGSHVVDELARRGHEVVVFDRFSTGSARYTAPNVTQVAGDFRDKLALMRAFDGIEYAYHFLTTTTPATSQTDPHADIEGISASVELFNIASDAGIKRLFFASSGGAIYGNQDLELVPETTNALPTSPYAIGKLALEGYLRFFEATRGLQSTALRLSNPYGPRQHPERKQGVIPIFLQRLARGETATILGDGSMVRDYVYVTDVARMICAFQTVEPEHHVYNVGSGQGSSVLDVVESIERVTGKMLATTHLTKPPTYVDKIVLDTSRFQNEISPAPARVSLDEGILATWKEIRNT